MKEGVPRRKWCCKGGGGVEEGAALQREWAGNRQGPCHFPLCFGPPVTSWLRPDVSWPCRVVVILAVLRRVLAISCHIDCVVR